MVNKNVVLSILAVGSVFSVLVYITENNLDSALTILFLTVYLLVLLRLIEEWRWFRSHNAAPASSLFIGTLTYLAIASALFANHASLTPFYNIGRSIVDISINLAIIEGTLTLYLNLFGVIFSLVFVAILLLLLRNYFTGRYPIVFFYRRRLRREFPITYSGILGVIIILYWFNSGIIEISSLIYVIGILVFFIETYIIKIVSVTVGYVLPSSTSERSSGRTRSSRTSRTRSSRTSRVSNSRTTNRASRSTRNSTRTQRARSTARRRRHVSNTNSDISVAPAIDTTPKTRRKKSTVRLNKKVLARIMPKGKVSEDDFRCIFCYEFPVTTRVVICPYCRHPAHEFEFERWHEVSNLCSRCNNELTSKNIIRISGAGYSKLIKLFKNRMLNK